MDFNTICLWLGRAFAFYVAYTITTTLYYLCKLYIFPNPVDFSKYGKWSGKL